MERRHSSRRRLLLWGRGGQRAGRAEGARLRVMQLGRGEIARAILSSGEEDAAVEEQRGGALLLAAPANRIFLVDDDDQSSSKSPPGSGSGIACHLPLDWVNCAPGLAGGHP